MLSIEEVSFLSDHVLCRGNFHRPNEEGAPIIVMAHGFGGANDVFLPEYAQAFVEAGYGVLRFDYRHLGASDGEPRQVIDPSKQIEDYHSALSYLRQSKFFKGNAIVLWGTSFAGGHVLEVAAKDHDIAAIVSQVPHVPKKNTQEVPAIGTLLRLMSLALLDSIKGLWRGATFVPLTAEEGGHGLLTTDGSYKNYGEYSLNHSQTFKNEVAARVMFAVASYFPGLKAGEVQCPILFLAAEDDSMVNLDEVKEVTADSANAILKVVPGGHYSVYPNNDAYQQTIQIECDFLKRVFDNTEEA